MASLSDLRPGQKLPERPVDYRQRSVWIVGRRSLKVGYSDAQGTDGGSSFTVSCSPGSGNMRSVAVFRGDDRYTDPGNESPTQLYRRTQTRLVWSRSKIHRTRQAGYDQACQEGEASIAEILQPFRDAVERGGVAAVPLSRQGDDERRFLATLIEEYAFQVGQSRQQAKLNGADPATVPSVVFHHGGSHFFGIDLDGNQEFDVMVARQDHSGRQVFLYDLERVPTRLREAVPNVAMQSYKEHLLRFPCATGPHSDGTLSDFERQACGGFWEGAFIPAAPREHDPQAESGPRCGYCACVRFKHPAGYIAITSSTDRRTLIPFAGSIIVLHGGYSPSIYGRDEVPLLLPTRIHQLPPLPSGEIWLPQSFRLEEPRWISGSEGGVNFQIQSVRPDGSRRHHSFHIGFTYHSDCDVEIGETLELN